MPYLPLLLQLKTTCLYDQFAKRILLSLYIIVTCTRCLISSPTRLVVGAFITDFSLSFFFWFQLHDYTNVDTGLAQPVFVFRDTMNQELIS